jgi:hypothetical protein
LYNKKVFFCHDHPQEDYFLVSKKFPIFVSADGVTLIPEKRDKYPNPSGVYEIEKIFCEKIILESEKTYKKFEEKDFKNIFLFWVSQVWKKD